MVLPPDNYSPTSCDDRESFCNATIFVPDQALPISTPQSRDVPPTVADQFSQRAGWERICRCARPTPRDEIDNLKPVYVTGKLAERRRMAGPPAFAHKGPAMA